MKRRLYIDSSVLVNLAVAGDSRHGHAQKEWISEFSELCTSELAVAECQSGLSASGAPPAAEQNLNRLLARLTLFQVSPLVLGHARSLVKRYRATVGLRSLDAIHVATANLVREALTGLDEVPLNFLTADRRQFEAFTAEGFLGKLLPAG